MTDYDEPLEVLQGVPMITISRLKRAGVKTILGAEARIVDPKGLGIPPHQLDELRNSIHDWKNGIERSTTD